MRTIRKTPCDILKSLKPTSISSSTLTHDPFSLFSDFSVVSLLKYFYTILRGFKNFSFLLSLRLFELEEVKHWVGQNCVSWLLICFETETEIEALKIFVLIFEKRRIFFLFSWRFYSVNLWERTWCFRQSFFIIISA